MTTNAKSEQERLVQTYLANGRIPWSSGYKPYRTALLQEVVRDEQLLARFRSASPLPDGHGFGVDERVVEYPWVLSRLGCQPGLLFDAGSTLNYPYLLDLPQLASKTIVIMTLAPEWVGKRSNVFYLYGDLRDIFVRDGVFSSIVSISTLEHIGLDNTRLYTPDARYRETRPQDCRKVMAEFRRLLAPGGRVLLTVPFGRAENLGWMQQFDSHGLEDIADAFGAAADHATFFRYTPTGWELSDLASCAECEYYDVRTAATPAPDRAAAARAVACMDFVRKH